MLELKNVTKDYQVSDDTVQALRGVNITFPAHSFVAMLGQSGCGKTTLLNIVGGLDHATDGELTINGISTKDYGEKDWNDYRNDKIGFVFQSYNLIPHMTVLGNVELALTLAGISATERKERAMAALAKVGLSSQAKKKPNQISGGQAQRVAIARAIVNSPKILLADEPTGAVDSETSIEIMNVLRDISKEYLVILVTHNQELAYDYADRIVKMKDGLVVGDESNISRVIDSEGAFDSESEIIESPEVVVSSSPKKKKTTMSFSMATRLSFNNLISKKGRSILTVIAGSISIICIALILAMNSGFASYITAYETDSLAKYPIMVKSASSSVMDLIQKAIDGEDIDVSQVNLNSIVDLFKNDEDVREKYTEEQIIYMSKVLLGIIEDMGPMGEDRGDPIDSMGLKFDSDISLFTKELDEKFDKSMGTIRKDYGMSLNIYQKLSSGNYTQLNPLYDNLMSTIGKMVGGIDVETQNKMRIMMDSLNTWSMMVDDNKVISSQYDILAGKLPDYEREEGMKEIVLVVDEYNQIDDYLLFCLGKITIGEFFLAMLTGKTDSIPSEYNFDEFLGKEFTLMASSDYYTYNNDSKLYDFSDSKQTLNERGILLKISGIVRLKQGVSGGCIGGAVGYTQALAELVINKINSAEITKAQIALREKYDENIAALTALKAKMDVEGFDMGTLTDQEKLLLAAAALKAKMDVEGFDIETLSLQEKMLLATGPSLSIKSVVSGEYMDVADYEQFLTVALDVKDLEQPSNLYIYPSSIEGKDKIIELINNYNNRVALDVDLAESSVEYGVSYTDNLSDITDSMSSMINTITYILIGVAAIAVVVAMLLVAIILYISVQDRTKEIGILRALGASRGNVSSVFVAETFIIGLVSGITGVVLGLIAILPANAIIAKVMGIKNLLQPVWWQEILLIALSLVITVISGLIPASVAAKKDPVLALRSDQ